MIVYHGSDRAVSKPDVMHSRKIIDECLQWLGSEIL